MEHVTEDRQMEMIAVAHGLHPDALKVAEAGPAEPGPAHPVHEEISGDFGSHAEQEADFQPVVIPGEDTESAPEEEESCFDRYGYLNSTGAQTLLDSGRLAMHELTAIGGLVKPLRKNTKKYRRMNGPKVWKRAPSGRWVYSASKKAWFQKKVTGTSGCGKKSFRWVPVWEDDLPPSISILSLTVKPELDQLAAELRMQRDIYSGYHQGFSDLLPGWKPLPSLAIDPP
jgi:hypothetical protein